MTSFKDAILPVISKEEKIEQLERHIRFLKGKLINSQNINLRNNPMKLIEKLEKEIKILEDIPYESPTGHWKSELITSWNDKLKDEVVTGCYYSCSNCDNEIRCDVGKCPPRFCGHCGSFNRI